MGGYRLPILVATGLSMAGIAYTWQQDVETAVLVLVTVLALAVFSIKDLETRTIPNRLVYPFAGLTWAWVGVLVVVSGDDRRWFQAVGVTILYTVMFLVLWFLGHLGAGDVKLLFAVLIVVGWLGVVPAMLWVVSSWLPAVVHGLVVKLKHQNPGVVPQAQYFWLGFVVTAFLSQYLEQL